MNSNDQKLRGSMTTEDGGFTIPHFPICARNILNKMTVCYGTTGDGKTTVMQNCIYALEDYVAKIYVVSPSEPTNENFKGIAPPGAVILDIEKEGLESFVKSLWDAQQKASMIYKRASNLAVLASLYRYIVDPKTDKTLAEFNKQIDKQTKKRDKLSALKMSYKIDVLTEMIAWSITQSKEGIVKTYISAINNKIDVFNRMPNLTEDQKFTLSYMHVRPYTALIFDDCIAELGAILKKDWFIRLFTRGRHVNLTTIIAAHDDTNLSPPLRIGVHNAIYCNSTILYKTISRGGWSKKDIKDIEEVARHIFEVLPIKSHTKFVYLRESRFKYRYLVATKYEKPIKIGSPMFWKYCTEIYVDPSNVSVNDIRTPEKKKAKAKK